MIAVLPLERFIRSKGKKHDYKKLVGYGVKPHDFDLFLHSETHFLRSAFLLSKIETFPTLFLRGVGKTQTHPVIPQNLRLLQIYAGSPCLCDV